jgi:Mor family transcriptional regulator
MTKYSDKDIFNILTSRLNGEVYSKIGKKYNCDESYIRLICFNKIKLYNIIYLKYIKQLEITEEELQLKFKRLSKKNTSKQVFNVLDARFNNKLTYDDINKKFGCSKKTIHNICLNKQPKFKHIYAKFASQLGLTSEELKLIKINKYCNLTKQQLFNIYDDKIIHKIKQQQIAIKYDLNEVLISKIINNKIQKYKYAFTEYIEYFRKLYNNE